MADASETSAQLAASSSSEASEAAQFAAEPASHFSPETSSTGHVETPAALPAIGVPNSRETESAPRSESEAAAPPESDDSYFGWRRGDQIFFGTLLVAAMVLLAVHWARMSGWGIRMIEIERQEPLSFEYRLDVNQANWIEWTQLPGVGDEMARRIVAYREEHGPFREINDLQQVPGIGPKTLEKLHPWIEISPAGASDGSSTVNSASNGNSATAAPRE